MCKFKDCKLKTFMRNSFIFFAFLMGNFLHSYQCRIVETAGFFPIVRAKFTFPNLIFCAWLIFLLWVKNYPEWGVFPEIASVHSRLKLFHLEDILF